MPVSSAVPDVALWLLACGASVLAALGGCFMSNLLAAIREAYESLV